VLPSGVRSSVPSAVVHCLAAPRGSSVEVLNNASKHGQQGATSSKRELTVLKIITAAPATHGWDDAPACCPKRKTNPWMLSMRAGNAHAADPPRIALTILPTWGQTKILG
jgi:hypothetical protein